MAKRKIKKHTMLDLIKKSRPRPEVRLRSTVFEDKTKYKRSREKESLHREFYI